MRGWASAQRTASTQPPHPVPDQDLHRLQARIDGDEFYT
jgi:hypothetical protein